MLLQGPPHTDKTSLPQLIMRSKSGHVFKHVVYISLAHLSSGSKFKDIGESYVPGGISFPEMVKPAKTFPEGKFKQPTSQANMRPFLLVVDKGHVGFTIDLDLWSVLKSVQ